MAETAADTEETTDTRKEGGFKPPFFSHKSSLTTDQILKCFVYFRVKKLDKKLNIAILFGGRSTEHQISLLSAQNVVAALDKDKFIPQLIAIDKKGQWFYFGQELQLLNSDDPKNIALAEVKERVYISQNTSECILWQRSSDTPLCTIDVIFPVLHGNYGEDGSIQGLAQLANIACVGCGILGSALCMDKDIMKKLLRDSGIPTAKWHLQRDNENILAYDELVKNLGTDLFIKPATLGSSVGISFVNNSTDYLEAVKYALEFDSKVIIEEKVEGREIECAVLGNDKAKASLPGEVIPKSSFYSYENKYLDENGALLHVPAQLEQNQTEAIQELALKCFNLLECSGMARLDVFLKENDVIIVNEVNTIPGFTNISMYPKLWEETGLPQTELISALIELAIEDNNKRNKLRLI